jgi:hypothetical protein
MLAERKRYNYNITNNLPLRNSSSQKKLVVSSSITTPLLHARDENTSKASKRVYPSCNVESSCRQSTRSSSMRLLATSRDCSRTCREWRGYWRRRTATSPSCKSRREPSTSQFRRPVRRSSCSSKPSSPRTSSSRSSRQRSRNC